MSKIRVDEIVDEAGTGSPSFPHKVNAADLTGALPALNGSAVTSLSAANLTGTLPALNGSAVTSLSAANLTGALPALNGSAVTSLSAANLTGALPALDGSALTGLSSGGTLYTSGAHTFNSSGASWSHGLGVQPKSFGAYFNFVSSVGSFSSGMNVQIHGTGDDDSSGSVVYATSTTIGAGFYSQYYIAYPNGSNRVTLQSYRSSIRIHFWAIV